jgi:hypothetical protein
LTKAPFSGAELFVRLVVKPKSSESLSLDERVAYLFIFLRNRCSWRIESKCRYIRVIIAFCLIGCEGV